MSRPHKKRHCHLHTGDRVFKPRSVPMAELERVSLSLSELEALRLCDVEGMDQAGAGARMGVSRGTVQRLLREARRKVSGAIVRSEALVIERGEAHESVYSNGGSRGAHG